MTKAKKKDASMIASMIADSMGSMADKLDSDFDTFDRKSAAEKIGEILTANGLTPAVIRELERQLSAERDCVLRQQRQINRLEQEHAHH